MAAWLTDEQQRKVPIAGPVAGHSAKTPSSSKTAGTPLGLEPSIRTAPTGVDAPTCQYRYEDKTEESLHDTLPVKKSVLFRIITPSLAILPGRHFRGVRVPPVRRVTQPAIARTRLSGPIWA